MTQALSPDQAAARDRIADVLRETGVDIDLLATVVKALAAAGVEAVSGEHEPRRTRDKRNFAVLAPTNKAASVLRNHGVPATTIHRIVYTPVYAPEFQKIADWLAGQGPKPAEGKLDAQALDRAHAFFARTPSIPGALAAAGLRGSDFITGWTRRDAPLDIALVDEASMLDDAHVRGFAANLFSTDASLFGDPAQLAPVGQRGAMVVRFGLAAPRRLALHRIHRQAADNPILDLAHALGDPDDRLSPLRGTSWLMEPARRATHGSRWRAGWPIRSRWRARRCWCWRNATRIRLIQAFRAAHGAPGDGLIPGEPLICDGIELPVKHRKKRLDLEARGLIKGAQAIWLGPGRKPGFARLHLIGAEDPRLSVAAIIKIEYPGEEEPAILTAARMGAAFLHGAAVTIHKAQGSQWPVVQVFAPDLYAAARSGREEAGQPLWKRLAYVAVTRAEERLVWVTRYRLARPTAPLSVADLDATVADLRLEAGG
jgi:exodeoxyribonuclease-5